MPSDDFRPLFVKASDNLFYLFIRRLETWEDKGKYAKWIEQQKINQTIQLEEATEERGWKSTKCWAIYQEVPINTWIQADLDIRYVYDPIGGRIEPYHKFYDSIFVVDDDELDPSLEDVE